MNQLLNKTLIAGAAIAARRIVKFSAAETVIQAAAVGDLLVGVSSDIAAASGERVDVMVVGIALIEAGAPYAITARLTTDSVGRAVAAAPAGGVNNAIIGIPLEAASAAGDICRVLLCQHSLQG